jgi:PUL domain
MKIANTFSTPLLTISGISNFNLELVDLFTAGILSETPKLVKASASAIFNLSRLYLVESMSPTEDDVIAIVVALVQSLRTSLESDPQDPELARLIVVCLGGFVVLGKEFTSVKEVLVEIGSVDIVKKFKGVEGDEVAALIGG